MPPIEIRVCRGHATAEELAALTALLMARAAASRPPSATGGAHPWHPRFFEAPHSWQRVEELSLP